MPAPHQKNKLHPADLRNLIIFAIAFGIIYLLFDTFLLSPHMDKINAYHQASEQRQAAAAAPNAVRPPESISRSDALPQSPRVTIASDSLLGSINLTGARLDDINLRHYFETMDQKKPVAVMSPEHTIFPRYAEFGWLGNNDTTARATLPNDQTLWQVTSKDAGKVTLEWKNNQGLVFERNFEITDKFLIKVTQRVRNNSPRPQILFPYALLREHGAPDALLNKWIVHEGPIGFINHKLEERKYKKMPKTPSDSLNATNGWIGFTEQYWLTALLPDQQTPKTFSYTYSNPKTPGDTKSSYQVDIRGDGITINTGETADNVTYIFAGAKDLNILKKYTKELGVPSLESAIDFGWFWFLTKPFFTIMLMINGVIGHFGTTILIFAFLLRLCIFPMANASYRSFAKIRVIAPKITQLKEEYGDDKAGMQKALMALYQKEKVNPAAGCLPMLIQIPIFFSLYKVLNVAIEMRHAPGFLWINDLSAPDPHNLFTLFGFLPFDLPSFIFVGAWPCLMVLTLLIQKSMNPPPTDPIIRDMFRLMPFMMGFIMSGFAAGLVIYWTFSNLLSAIQQYTIMRMMGVDVKIFQGWFGRSHQDSTPDMKRLGLSDDIIGLHHKKDDLDGDALAQEAADKPPKDITPPKPKRKKKK